MNSCSNCFPALRSIKSKGEEIEKDTLRPLRVYRYEFKQQHIVTVMKNGHACLAADKHYYSVLYRFIGKKVKIQFTKDRIEIYYKYEQVAVHQRQGRK